VSARRTTRAAAAVHASSLAAVILVTAAAGRPVIWAGVLAVAGPLAAGLALRPHDGFVRAHVRAALAFNASLALYLVAIVATIQVTAGSPYTVQLVPFLLFVNMLLAFNWLVFTGIAVHRAATGQLFTDPLTLPRLGPAHVVPSSPNLGSPS
jgi:uncharacterized Tic20 family protein